MQCNGDMPLLEDFPCVKRPRFDTEFKGLSVLQQRRFVLKQRQLYEQFGIAYECGEAKSAFETFKQHYSENPNRDVEFFSLYPFDPVTAEALVLLHKNTQVMRQIDTAYNRLTSSVQWYSDLFLQLDFFEEINYNMVNFKVKYAELVCFKHMIDSCILHLTNFKTPPSVMTEEDAAFITDALLE